MSEQPEQGSRLGDYLSHMLEAIRLARAYTEGMDKRAFLEDKRTQQAVILNLLTLGEAASHIAPLLSHVFRQPPATPLEANAWHAQPYGARLFRYNLEIVWETMCNDLPGLEATIHTVIETDSGS